MKGIKKLAVMAILAAVFTIGSVAPGFADAVGGRKFDNFSIRPFSNQSFTVCFVGGTFARVFIRGNGATDIDLYIYDEAGRCVAYDTENSDACFVQWVPSYTSCYTVKVINRGARDNNYEIF